MSDKPAGQFPHAIPSLADLGVFWPIAGSGGPMSQATWAEIVPALGLGALGLFVAKGNGLKGDLQSIADATMGSNSAIVTSASNGFTNAKAGMIARVCRAPGNATLTTTILSVQGAGQVTLATSSVPSVSNAQMIFGTDDTAALNTLIATVASGGGGTILFDPGAYYIHGTCGGSHGENSQIRLPSVDITNLTGFVNINLTGPTPAPSWGYTPTLTDPQGGALLFSDVESDGTGSVINGLGSVNDGNGLFRTNIQVNISNLTIRVVDFRHPAGDMTNFGPSANCLNFKACQQAVIDKVVLEYTDPQNLISSVGVSSWTTAPNWGTRGILMPGFAGALVSLVPSYATISGWPVGISIADHFSGQTVIAVLCSVAAMEIPFSAHLISIANFSAEQNKTTVLVQPGQRSTASVDLHIDVEFVASPSWMTGGYLIEDTDNLLRGIIHWHGQDVVTGFGGQSTPVPRLNGAKYITLQNDWNERYPVVLTGSPSYAVDVPTVSRGKFSISLNGTSQYGTGPAPIGTQYPLFTAPGTIPNLGPFSFCIRFKSNGTMSSADFGILDMRNNTNGAFGFYLYLDHTNRELTYLAIDESSHSSTIAGGTDVDDTAWHDAVVTCDGSGTVTLYLDGSSLGTGTFYGWQGNAPRFTQYLLGVAYPISAFWKGKLADLRWYNSELSSGDVTNYHNNALVSDPFPLSVLTCDEGAGTVLFDTAL
jgi:hypothetical protein